MVQYIITVQVNVKGSDPKELDSKGIEMSVREFMRPNSALVGFKILAIGVEVVNFRRKSKDK
jgi:hypothetical protein